MAALRVEPLQRAPAARAAERSGAPPSNAMGRSSTGRGGWIYGAVAATLLPLLWPAAARADHTVALPVAQVSLSLPGSAEDWRVRTDDGADILERTVPAAPALRIRFVVQDQQAADCAAALRQVELDVPAGVVPQRSHGAAYLPASWGPYAVEVAEPAEQRAVACAARREGGVALGMVSVTGGNLGAEAATIRRLLAGFAAGMNGSPDGPLVPLPEPPAGEGGGSAGGTEPPPAAPRPSVESRPLQLEPVGPADGPPVPLERPDQPDDDEQAGQPLGLGIELSVLHLAPEAPAFPGAVGVTGGLYGSFNLYDGDVFRLDLHVNGALGYDGNDNWLGDMNVGAQPTVYVGPIGLSMVGGGGWDTISGSDADTVWKAPSAIYGFIGGRLDFDVVAAVGLVGGVDQLFRNDELVDAETRVHGGARLWFGGPVTFRILFRYAHYTGADALGGSLGVGF